MESTHDQMSEHEKQILIERIVAKAELEFKCSGSHFSCEGEAGIEAE